MTSSSNKLPSNLKKPVNFKSQDFKQAPQKSQLISYYINQARQFPLSDTVWENAQRSKKK